MNIETKSLPIGFFDSGVGGLSVLARFRDLLPNENIIYFGDTKNLPYGNKSQSELIGFARNILDFFIEHNIKAVVIACNTSSAQVYDIIKNEYNIPIYPIIQSCAKVIAGYNYDRIGVFATEATVKAHKYKAELTKYNPIIEVTELASKDWVSIVEGTNPNLETAKNNIKHELDEMLKFKPKKIILGCTHYPYLLPEFAKYLNTEIFIDPAEIFALYIKQDLNKLKLLNSNTEIGYEKFYVSSNPEKFIKNAEIFYKIMKPPIIKSF